MRILYVEDELSKNVPRITRLFGKYLRKKRIEALEALEKDESGYGAEPEKVKKIVEETHLIEVDYRFPDALHKIIHHPEKYSLFIIDRNLVEDEYEFEEVREIDQKYSEEQYERFFEREGDYLLQKLVFSGVDVVTKFYFLTAHPAQDEIRGSDKIRSGKEIENLINFGQFNTENFIEKGNNTDFERLHQILNNIKILNLQNENSHYLDILRTYVDNKIAEGFVKILDEKDDTQRIMNSPNEMRMIYEKILQECSKRIPGMKEHCTDNYSRTILGQQTIEWLYKNGHVNTILKPFFYNFSIITNILSHPTSEHPTTDTINALVYALKDIIVWFEGICRKYSKK